ncbi:MAG: selenide, water dikinase SelD, partial [Enterococcus sp.]|nr:selenide, water dikinase SelD [Enterococcus sp.]
MESVQQLIVCGGCNAKIGPGNLGELLADLPKATHEDLLVGFDSTDDAAVIKLRE